MGINPGDSALVVNGLVVDIDQMDIYQLTDLLKKEEKLAAGFNDLGFKVCFIHFFFQIFKILNTKKMLIYQFSERIPLPNHKIGS